MPFYKTTMPTFTQLELFSHGLKNMKMKFSIFTGHHIVVILHIIEPVW
jgi:hypothetical protein